MPPKKKEAKTVVEDPEPDEQIVEEEEEGPGRATFTLSCGGVTNLPCELETVLQFTGACRPNRSLPAPASAAPSGWELQKSKFIRTCNQQLYDDLVDKELVIKLRDTKEDDIIGQVNLSLLPLLHNETMVGGELDLKLTPEYHRRWFIDPEEEQEVKPKKGKKAEPKAKKEDAAPAPSPEPTAEAARAAAASPSQPPPTTKIIISVEVQDLVAPEKDRTSWTSLMLGVRGIYALPERLTALGLPNPDDLDLHPLRYRAALLGVTLGEGALKKALKPRPEVQQEEAGETEETELPLAEWQAQKENYDPSIRFKTGELLKKYRGADFVDEFRKMLNHTGGVWFYLLPEEKPPLDAKKGHPAEVQGSAAFYQAKAWLDLRALIRRGSNRAEARCPLTAADPAASSSVGLPSWESSRAYVHLVLELSHDLTPPEHPSLQVDIDTLLPEREPVNKFPNSRVAEKMYCEALERTVDLMAQDCSGMGKTTVQEVLDTMKRSGSYEEVKEHLRRTIVSVMREQLRKDTSIVPGQLLETEAREKFMARTYAYLSGTAGRVLDELRKRNPATEPPEPPAVEPPPAESSSTQLSPLSPAGYQASLQPTPAGYQAAKQRLSSKDSPAFDPQKLRRSSTKDPSPSRKSYMAPLSRDPTRMSIIGSLTPDDEQSPSNGGSLEMPADPPASRLANAVALGPKPSRSWKALNTARDKGERFKRLALEAEMVGNYDRAAQMIQNRLLLDQFRNDPQEWVIYAKVCARARGRQAAAEEALRQAVQIMADSSAAHSEETAMEVDLMLSCLLLDRGRHEEAIKVLRVWHEKDISDPCRSFLLGLALFLAGEGDAARPLLESVAKPSEWFRGLRDDAAVAAQLQKSRSRPDDPKRYAACLERLLEFGLPSLVFTFIDQCGTLSEEELAQEPIVLMDAKASAMDRDFAASTSRLERLLTSGNASREAWRQAGESYLQMQEIDKALQAFNTALSFDQKFDDPAVYLHLGRVLLAKKRWKQASSMLLRSIQCKSTAEAWSGVAYSEYRADELQPCYEALCEAALLDNARPDVWALLTLVHLRQENHEAADDCFSHCLTLSPDCEELLIEVSTEYTRRERQPNFAEVAVRRALELRESGLGHHTLADILASQGRLREAAEEARAAVRLLVTATELRKTVLDRALKWCGELGDAELTDSLLKAQEAAEFDLLQIVPPSP